jgi:hypothetical protein
LITASAQEGFIKLSPVKESILPLDLSNPQAQSLVGMALLQDARGKEIWSQSVSLTAAQRVHFEVALPKLSMAESSGPLYTVMLQIQGASGPQVFRIPFRQVFAYAIHHAPGNPLKVDLTDFVQRLPVIKVDQLENVYELAFDPAIPRWRGPDELSIQARACHDESGIYFRFDVTDEKQIQHGPPDQMWKGASLQLAVGAAEQPNYTIMTLGLLKEGPVAWCSESSYARFKGRSDVPLRITRLGKITTYEVYLPYDNLGISPTTEPQPIRFSFLANEDNGQGRVRWIHWNDGIGKGQDLNLLGYGTLESQ